MDYISRCEEFARQGCKVYATSRKIESIADFGNTAIETIPLDVTSDESVENALKHIIEKEGKIDVVVNNAGLLAPGTRIS
jgi:1-acylglycerone phosphate reductase